MARKAITETVTLHGASRLNSSVNSNPRFTLHTSAGDYMTQSDAAINYEVDNITRGRNAGANVRVELTMTPAGRVYDIRPV